MNKRYFEKLNTEKLAEIKKNNLEKFEFSVIDEMIKAESASKELTKNINDAMKNSGKMYDEMDKFAKQATKEVNAMIKKYNALLKKGGKFKDEVEKQERINDGVYDNVIAGAKALGMKPDEIKGFKAFSKSSAALTDVKSNFEYDFLGESFGEENWQVG